MIPLLSYYPWFYGKPMTLQEFILCIIVSISMLIIAWFASKSIVKHQEKAYPEVVRNLRMALNKAVFENSVVTTNSFLRDMGLRYERIKYDDNLYDKQLEIVISGLPENINCKLSKSCNSLWQIEKCTTSP